MGGNIYQSNPYLNPSGGPYSGDMYGGGSGQGDYGLAGDQFEDEPPLLEGKVLLPIGNLALELFTSTTPIKL